MDICLSEITYGSAIQLNCEPVFLDPIPGCTTSHCSADWRDFTVWGPHRSDFFYKPVAIPSMLLACLVFVYFVHKG